MYITFIDKTPIYKFEIFKPFEKNISHGVFTRHTRINDKKKIASLIDSTSQPVFFQEQLHGTHMHIVKKSFPTDIKGDVLISQTPEIPLGIRIADCGSILLYDPIAHVIANIHAGWRGLAARVIRATFDILNTRFKSKPENIFAGISPMIGPCCSTFSNPYKELPRFLHQYITEENNVNLWAVAQAQLRECGVPASHIENPRICTMCNPEDFFSYRRGDTHERFGTVIMLY